MHRLRILVMPLLAGNVLYVLVGAGLLSGRTAISLFFLLWGADVLTLPVQGRLAYRHGFLSWALWSHAARVFSTFRRVHRLRLAADVAWILLDLGRDNEAAFWLSRQGGGSADREPAYAACLARYLLRAQARPSLAMDLADAALQQEGSARTHYVRGLCYLAVQENHSAIAAFENARLRAVSARDTVLVGLCYLAMGEAWNRIGEREYAQDHLLRAEIMLSFLPADARHLRHLPGRPENAVQVSGLDRPPHLSVAGPSMTRKG